MFMKSHDSVHILKQILYFADRHYELLYRIAMHTDIDLKYLGLISSASMGNLKDL